MLNNIQKAICQLFCTTPEKPRTKSRPRKTLVLAGSYQHACFCAEKLLNLKRCEWSYVAAVEQLCGVDDADIWVYQSWLSKWMGDDFDQIVSRLNSIKHRCNINHINEHGRTFPVD